MRIHVADWSESTQRLDPEQKGWYLNLLSWAHLAGEPPGYLPDDDEQLRYIAEVSGNPKGDSVPRIAITISADEQ